MNRKQTNKLHRSIMVYAALGIFLTGIIIAAVSLIPLSNYLKKEQKRNLLLAVKDRALTVEQYLSRIKTVATLIPTRKDIYEELVRFKEGSRTKKGIEEDIVNLTETRLRDAMKLSPEIEGISRFSAAGNIKMKVGVPVPEQYLHENKPFADTITIEGPVMINNMPYLVCIVPVYDGIQQIGTDITIFSIQTLKEIVQDYTGLGETGETILGVAEKDSVRLFFFLRDNTQQTRMRGLDSPIGQGMKLAFSQETGVISSGDDGRRLVIAYTPVPDSRWGILVKMDAEELYGPIVNQIITIIIIILVFIGLGTLGMYLLLRPLSGRLLIHTDELEEQVDEKTRKLNLELNQRIKAQEELKKAHNTLEQRVKERTAELAETNQELKDFAYIVSHDLKAPLRAIASISDWLKEDYSDKLDEEGKEKLDLMKSRVIKMQQLIEGILEYSRAGRSQDEKEQVDINQLVDEVVEHIQVPENIEVINEGKCPVLYIERIPLFQVFQNFIDNAVKYMDREDGKITIGCTEREDAWEFYVKDNGPGIPEEYLENIFKIFQIVPGKKKEDSSGVGLAIINKIIQRNRGRVWVKSKVGEGTTFFFTLPKETENQ